MLRVDLGHLERRGRLTIEAELPPDHPMWEESDLELRGPLSVRLEAQWAAGDVLVRGRLAADLTMDCRRCLEQVAVQVEAPVSFAFRRGVAPEEAEREEIYPIPERAHEIDLTDAVREHFLLAVPRFVICQEACRGLCPRCGTNLNLTECKCEVVDADTRWAPLRKLKLD